MAKTLELLETLWKPAIGMKCCRFYIDMQQ